MAEVVGGVLTGWLALISDAAHMGTDVLGVGLALAAMHLASRPAAGQRTYGTYRLEVLAAVINGLLLFGVAGYVLFEAYRRIQDPPEVLGVPMLAVAVVGLAVNIASFRLLSAGAQVASTADFDAAEGQGVPLVLIPSRVPSNRTDEMILDQNIVTFTR